MNCFEFFWACVGWASDLVAGALRSARFIPRGFLYIETREKGFRNEHLHRAKQGIAAHRGSYLNTRGTFWSQATVFGDLCILQK